MDQKLFSVYVLRSEKYPEKNYVGMATDVVKRLKEHNSGKSKFTKAFIPWTIVHQELVGEAPLARKREKYLKSNAGKNFLRKIGAI